jgi:protein TonB
LTVFISFGLFLKTVKPSAVRIMQKISGIESEFIFEEKKAVPKPVIKAVKKKPVDLTNKTELNKKEDDIQKTAPKTKKIRKVYGLRKVYSKGLGSGGNLSNAVIGKLGNTINKEVDDLKATNEEIKGKLVSTSSITSAPKFRKKVKPKYTKEMLENNVEGIVKVKVLVDTDGKVKNSKALNDLGFGSKLAAIEACNLMEFYPAQKDDQSVAVWIIIPVRFVMLS